MKETISARVDKSIVRVMDEMAASDNRTRSYILDYVLKKGIYCLKKHERKNVEKR